MDSTVASIILKWKKFRWLFLELGFSKRGDQEPDGHSGGAPEILCGDGRNFQKDKHPYNLSGLYGRVARLKPLFSERHMKACLEFIKK